MKFSTFVFAGALAVSGGMAFAGTITFDPKPAETRSGVSTFSDGAPAVTFDIVAASRQGSGNDADAYAGTYDGTTPLGAEWFNGAFKPLGDGSLTAASAPLVTPPPGFESGAYRSPFQNTPLGETQTFFSIGGSKTKEDGVTNGGGTPMTLEFAGSGVTKFSFLWGSIDSYNEIEFFDEDQTSLGFLLADTLNGFINSVFDPEGNEPGLENVALLSIFAEQDFAIKYIAFSSTTAALEIAFQNPALVPLPASGLLLIGALGGLYGARRRRKA